MIEKPRDMQADIKEILSTFLNQSYQQDHRTSHYPERYNGLDLKVGFGVGKSAKIPWICFLGLRQTPQKGIFPVYYYFKDNHKLILAYGISETNKPNINWVVPPASKTIESFFRPYGIIPHKYHHSFVYKDYSTIKELDWNIVENDLDELIQKYKSVMKK